MKSKKGIEDALGLPSIEELKELDTEGYEIYIPEEDEFVSEPDSLTLEEAQAAMLKLKEHRLQLKDIPDVTARKVQLIRLAELAEEKFNDILDRAFNCEDRFASEMTNAAIGMLKLALDAQSKVIDSDVKLIDLQIKKDKIEVELNIKNNNSGSVSTGQSGEKVTLVNTNERLAQRNANK